MKKNAGLQKLTPMLMASVLALSCAASWAARDFTPQAGTWVVSEELDGKPGRGLAIDVQGNTFFMQVFGYEKNGDATFYTATGQMDGNAVTAPLMQYQGGRSFGSDARDAVELGSPGQVKVSFANGLQGTVQFPGEAAVAIERLQMRSAEFEERYWVKKRLRSFMASAIDTEQQIAFFADLSLSASDTTTGELRMHLTAMPGDTRQSLSCERLDGRDAYRCKSLDPSEPTYGPSAGVEQIQLHIAGSDIYGTIDLLKNGASHRLPLQGINVSGGGEGIAMGCGQFIDLYVDSLRGCSQVSSPSSGTWIVADELQGKPGRGFAIDVYNGMMVAQVFNYLPSGAPTFHMGSAAYAGIEPSIPLNRYAGGRWIGGPAASGQLVGSAGNLSIRFSENAVQDGYDASRQVGIVQMPGEAPKRMVRMALEPTTKPLDSLVGKWWMKFVGMKTELETRLVDLTNLQGDKLTSSDGLVECTAMQASPGTWVQCLLPRANGSEFSAAFRNEPNYRNVRALQVSDRYGNLTGLGTVPLD